MAGQALFDVLYNRTHRLFASILRVAIVGMPCALCSLDMMSRMG